MENDPASIIINERNTKNGTIYTRGNGTRYLITPNGTYVHSYNRYIKAKQAVTRAKQAANRARQAKQAKQAANKAKQANKARQANNKRIQIIGPGKWIVKNPKRYQNVENVLSQNLGLSWVDQKLGKVYNRNNYKNYVVLNKNSKVLAYSIVNTARPILEIVAFGTNRSKRGSGIGSSLMNKIKTNAKNTGYRKIILSSVPTATGFYNKMGFTAPYANNFRQFNLSTRKRPRV